MSHHLQRRFGAALVIVALSIGAAAPSSSAAPVPRTHRQTPTEAENYVTWVYESLLFREPDPEGLDYWSEVVQTGDLATFVTFVVHSSEWRQAWVDGFYEGFWLDRPGDPAGLTYWDQFLAAGHSLSLIHI